MKKYSIMLLVPILALGGCASMKGRMDMDACAAVSATLIAKDANGPGRTFVQVKPDTVKVKAGCNFTLNNPGGHTVTISSPTPWLNAGPSNAATLSLGPATGSGTQKYAVDVAGIGSLDPRAFVF
jgi:hypothetical protein